jgi:hypothetical protein
MDKVFTSFENYVQSQKKYAKWFDMTEKEHDKMIELFYAGYACPLAERDEEGRRIIFIQIAKLDPVRFTSADAIRLTSVISASLMEEEETQIAGISSVVDHNGVTMKQVSAWSVADLVDFAQCCSKAVGRYKDCIVVNLAPISMFLFDVGRNALPEKFKKRIILAKNMEDAKNYICPKLLPQEFGGEHPLLYHQEKYIEYFNSVKPNLELIKKSVNVDWNKVPDLDTKVEETVGSFRKLEID